MTGQHDDDDDDASSDSQQPSIESSVGAAPPSKKKSQDDASVDTDNDSVDTILTKSKKMVENKQKLNPKTVEKLISIASGFTEDEDKMLALVEVFYTLGAVHNIDIYPSLCKALDWCNCEEGIRFYNTLRIMNRPILEEEDDVDDVNDVNAWETRLPSLQPSSSILSVPLRTALDVPGGMMIPNDWSSPLLSSVLAEAAQNDTYSLENIYGPVKASVTSPCVEKLRALKYRISNPYTCC